MKHILIGLLLVLCSTLTYASRKEILLNNDWMFRFSHQVQKTVQRESICHIPGTVEMPFPENRIIIAEWEIMKKNFL